MPAPAWTQGADKPAGDDWPESRFNSANAASRIRRSIGFAPSLLLSPVVDAGQSVLQPASVHSRGIEALWWVMFYGGLAIFLVVMALLGMGLWSAYRGKAGPLGYSASRNLVIAAGVAVPLLILIGLVGGSLFLGRSVASIPPDNALRVRVTGWMWWWQIDYLDAGGQVFATTANELHVPVGRPVAVELTSGDVIHSFWVPELQGKTDLVPGKINTSWFEAEEPGVHRGQCAEFCGKQHALMAFVVVAQTEAEFDNWLQQQSRPARPPETSAERRGKSVFQRSSCGSCHAIRGTDAAGRAGPDLTHLASRRTLAAATLPNNRGHLAGWIGDPQRIKPGSFMPRTLLEPDQLKDLLTYLESLE